MLFSLNRIDLLGLFDILLHVKYITYNITTEDCKSPERGWCSCTIGEIDTAPTMMHKIKLNEIKNLLRSHEPICKQIDLKKSSEFYTNICKFVFYEVSRILRANDLTCV